MTTRLMNMAPDMPHPDVSDDCSLTNFNCVADTYKRNKLTFGLSSIPKEKWDAIVWRPTDDE